MRKNGNGDIGAWSRGTTILITNLIKLSGLAIGLNELLIRPNARTVVLGLAGFMMAGAQFSEGVILTIIDRLLGRAAPPPTPVPATANNHSERNAP